MDRRTLIIGGAASAAAALHPAPLLAQAGVRTVKQHIAGVDRPWRHSRIADPTGSALSKKVERFELRGGDCKGDDCAAQVARVERQIVTDLTLGDRGQFVYHLYFASDEYNFLPKVVTTTGQLILYDRPRSDWHGGPLWRIESEPGSDKLYIRVSRLWTENGRLRTADYKSEGIGRLTQKITMNRWHQVAVDFGLSAGPDGYLTTYFDGRRVMDYSGPTALPGTQLGVSYGIHQARTNKYPGGARAMPPQVVYYVGPRFARA